MLGTTSFSILEEFNKNNQLWVWSSISPVAPEEASGLHKPFLWVPRSAVEIAPTLIRVS